MKKLLTFCFFALILLLSTQNATAQHSNKVNENAANSVKELRAQLKFDEVALEKIYYAYQEYESKMVSLKESTKPGDQYNKDKSFISSRLQQAIKNALPANLYTRYLIITEQDDIEGQSEN